MKSKLYRAIAVTGLVSAAVIYTGCSSDSDDTQQAKPPIVLSGILVVVQDAYATGCGVTAGTSTATAVDETASPGQYLFTGATDLPGYVSATGCTDASTGKALPPMSAPASSAGGVVTPVTTLINELMIATNMTAADAENMVSTALGLPAGVNLLTYDPFAAKDANSAAVASAAAQLNATLTLLNDATGNNTAAIAALVGLVRVGVQVNLTDAATLNEIAAVAGVDASVANAAAAVNGQIVAAASGTDLNAAFTTMAAATIVASNMTTMTPDQLIAATATVAADVSTAKAAVQTDGFVSVTVEVTTGATSS